MSNLKVHLITVAGDYVDVWPDMVEHYRSQGIELLIINAHSSSRTDPLLDRIEQAASWFETKIASVTVEPWSQTLMHCCTGSRVSERGYEFIKGCLVDRIAADGLLAPVMAEKDLFDQFPLGGCVTGPVLGGVINKVAAARGHVKVGPGQHHAY